MRGVYTEFGGVGVQRPGYMNERCYDAPTYLRHLGYNPIHYEQLHQLSLLFLWSSSRADFSEAISIGWVHLVPAASPR